jgi:hypothetical protein
MKSNLRITISPSYAGKRPDAGKSLAYFGEVRKILGLYFREGKDKLSLWFRRDKLGVSYGPLEEDKMADEPPSQVSKLLAALATAWILAGTSGAAWVAFNSIHDISGSQSDIRALNGHLRATDQRVVDLENRMDSANQRQDSTLDHLLENQGVCSSLVGRVNHLETRYDNLYVSDKQRRR